jgi:putative transposase
MAAPKKYSDELRERATRLALESGRPIAHVAQDLGVHKEALRTWVRQAKADAAGGTPTVLSSAERERLKELEREVRELRQANAILRAASVYFAVELVCRTLGVSRSAHYERASGRRSPRQLRDEQLVQAIRELHAANFEAYGYRKMHLALRRAGIADVGRDRVKRLMREHRIQGAKRRGKPWRTTTADPDATRRPDLVDRDFTATGPDRLYVADFTYLRCWEGVLFFAFVIDVYSRRIVGWQLTAHMRASLVCDALRMAVCTRPRHGADVQLVHHSDRGSQYSGLDFAQVLEDYDVLQSVGSVGDAYDNALAESFVDTLKTELIADRVWRTRSQLELAIVEYLGWFNHDRLHESLRDVPPAEFEALYAPNFFREVIS